MLSNLKIFKEKIGLSPPIEKVKVVESDINSKLVDTVNRQ